MKAMEGYLKFKPGVINYNIYPLQEMRLKDL